ncbi:MAG: DUF2092 domain-containing protein [Bacillus sp. (in: Bacteria)]|nr:DUF2092 domain-containing protein [Bacillus sp. (in: firmicutes)]
MKKTAGLSFLLGTVVLTASCGDPVDNNDENGSAGPDNGDAPGVNDENGDDTGDADGDVEEIVQSAIEAESGREDLYVREETLDHSGEEEEVIMAQELWFFYQNGELLERRETQRHDEPLEYEVNDGSETLIFTEGDDVAYLIEEQRADGYGTELSGDSPMIEEYFNTHEPEFLGEADVNGYATYHVRFSDENEQLDYWFEQESYFLVRHLAEYDDGEMANITEVLVTDFDLNPEFDEGLFNFERIIDDDVEVQEMSREEYMEETSEGDIDDTGTEN